MIILGLVVGALMAGSVNAESEEPGQGEDAFKTRWVVTPAIGMDAILLLGAASGDVMQAHIYAEDIEWVRDNLSADGIAALEEIDDVLRVKLGFLTGPILAYYFSAGPVSSIDDVIDSAANPVAVLKPGLEQSSNWDAQDFENAVRLMPRVHTALVALRDAGFSERYESHYMAAIETAVGTNLLAVQDFDIIPEQQRLLGRPLDSKVELLIVKYAQPYGIRITGQRFIAYYGWEGVTQLHIAAHEIFHPPYDLNDEELAELLKGLEADPWMTAIVENHDPRFGYNSFMGVINEGSTQALDQIVSERLGFAREPGTRWRESDGGMHLFAAAVYDAMIEDGFAEQGGQYSAWLKSALQRDLLSPAAVRRRAASVVGQDAVDAWGVY